MGAADREGRGQGARLLRGARLGPGHRGAGHANGSALRQHTPPGQSRRALVAAAVGGDWCALLDEFSLEVMVVFWFCYLRLQD